MPTERQSFSKRKKLGIAALLLMLLAGWLTLTKSGRQSQFLLGGAMVNLGYRMQDHLESYDFEHPEDISPDQVWEELKEQNARAALVRDWFPRTARHPLVALVVCMDARIDTNELTGDTRRYYYILRTAGSVLSEREFEMLELAVENGVELVVLTTHSDCAAENAASTPELRERFPALAKAVDERDSQIQEFLARPLIASKIAEGKLAVKLLDIDTLSERMVQSPEPRTNDVSDQQAE